MINQQFDIYRPTQGRCEQHDKFSISRAHWIGMPFPCKDLIRFALTTITILLLFLLLFQIIIILLFLLLFQTTETCLYGNPTGLLSWQQNNGTY